MTHLISETALRLFSMLPKHECELVITHNPHKGCYWDAKTYIEETEHNGWQNENAKARAIETGEIWEMQWYPETPVSFYRVCAPTLEELISFAQSYAGNS